VHCRDKCIFGSCKPFVAFSLYCNGEGGPKYQSFWNNSGKTQLIRTKFGTHAQVEEQHRLGNFGRDRPGGGKMGARTTLAKSVFVRYWPFSITRTSPGQVDATSGVSV